MTGCTVFIGWTEKSCDRLDRLDEKRDNVIDCFYWMDG